MNPQIKISAVKHAALIEYMYDRRNWGNGCTFTLRENNDGALVCTFRNEHGDHIATKTF